MTDIRTIDRNQVINHYPDGGVKVDVDYKDIRDWWRDNMSKKKYLRFEIINVYVNKYYIEFKFKLGEDKPIYFYIHNSLPIKKQIKIIKTIAKNNKK